MTFIVKMVRKTDENGIIATFKTNNLIRVRHLLSIAPQCYIMYYMEANSLAFLEEKEI